MKQCKNCLEQNTDGATNCVICGEGLPVAQVGEEAPVEEAKGTGLLELDRAISETEVKTLYDAGPIDPEAAKKLLEQAQADPKKFLEETGPLQLVEIADLKKAAIEVYHDSEAKVVHTHVIVNDITLIGREDPQRDVFPDIDLAKIEGVSASNASREHLRILRQGDKFFLYIYRGSTGTQVNKEIIDEARYGKKFEIQIGDRIILGGKVRLKLIKQ